MQVNFTEKQKSLLIAFCAILETRENEPSNHKKVNANYHSLAKQSNMSYNGVKKSMKVIKEKLCS